MVRSFHKRHPKTRHQTQRGSVLMLILVGVALFAALSYTVAEMMQGGNPDEITEQKAGLYANEIMDYVRNLQLAVKNLRISNGCSDTEISFENPVISSYVNPNAPSDNSCHVFDTEGGGMTWLTFNDIRHDNNYGTVWFATGDLGAARPVRRFGTDEEHDLFFVIAHRSDLTNYNTFLRICKSINEQMNVAEAPGNPEDLPRMYHGVRGLRFTGSYNANGNTPYNIGEDLAQYRIFCSSSTASSIYIMAPLILR